MRTTITINDRLLKALKQRALDSDETVSSLIEAAVVQQLLEDMEYLETAESRLGEPTYTYDEFAAQLRAEGLL